MEAINICGLGIRICHRHLVLMLVLFVRKMRVTVRKAFVLVGMRMPLLMIDSHVVLPGAVLAERQRADVELVDDQIFCATGHGQAGGELVRPEIILGNANRRLSGGR